MTEVFKDRYRVALGLATFSFVGILISIYRFYRLPHDLMLIDAGHPSLVNVYVTVAATLLLAAGALWFALGYRNEVIVFRDKQDTEQTGMTGEGTGANTAEAISLQQFEAQLENTSGDDATLQAGLQAVCKQLEAGQGALYVFDKEANRVELKYGYALAVSEANTVSYEGGEGLIGQAAVSGNTLYIDDIPEGYIKIISGLGSASPRFLIIAAAKKENEVKAVLEIATFTPLSDQQRRFVEDAAHIVAARLNN